MVPFSSHRRYYPFELPSFPTSSFQHINLPTHASQVFYTTTLSYALVNLKPLLPGHVLVSPLRRVLRLTDLSVDETADLFLAVRRVARMVERVYTATSLNIAVQDGVDAGQSVPHVHAHIIPRWRADLDHKGGMDAIYKMLDGTEGDVGAHQLQHQQHQQQLDTWGKERQRQRQREQSEGLTRSAFPAVDNDVREPRSMEEMRIEAEKLSREMEIEDKLEAKRLESS